MQLQQGNGISRRRGSRLETVVECQTGRADRVAKMVRGITVGQQIHELPVVRRRQDDVGLRTARTGHQLLEHGLSRGNPLDRVGAAK